MCVIIILIGASILLAGGFLIAFIWSAKTGQFEDDYTPGIRILFDDEKYTAQNNSSAKTKN